MNTLGKRARGLKRTKENVTQIQFRDEYLFAKAELFQLDNSMSHISGLCPVHFEYFQ